jgi:hypothetical protein
MFLRIRMPADIRWSYNPLTQELDVWDSQDGSIGHFQRTGYEGLTGCAQGRVSIITDDAIMAVIYGNRPMSWDKPIRPGDYSEEEADAIRDDAKRALENHVRNHGDEREIVWGVIY